MKKNKILSGLLSATLAMGMLASSAFAEDITMTPDGGTGLNKASDPSTEVTFVADAYNGIVGGEDNGQWILGGDNGDIGITKEMLESNSYLELSYTCDAPVEGVTIGFAFKVHVDLNSRTMEDGGYIFADYLPATWVPYGSGADGKQPIKAINSLEEIYQAPLKAEGILVVPTADLLNFFPEDMDYMMGIGIGANNNGDGIAEADLDEGPEYSVVVKEIKLTNDAPPDETEATEATEEPTSTEAETTAATTEADTSENAETTASTEASSGNTTAADGSGSGSSTVIIIVVIVAVVVIAAIIVIVVKKKK